MEFPSDRGTYYTDQGVDHYYAETPTQGWVVDQIPPRDDSRGYVYPR